MREGLRERRQKATKNQILQPTTPEEVNSESNGRQQPSQLEPSKTKKRNERGQLDMESDKKKVVLKLINGGRKDDPLVRDIHELVMKHGYDSWMVIVRNETMSFHGICGKHFDLVTALVAALQDSPELLTIILDSLRWLNNITVASQEMTRH